MKKYIFILMLAYVSNCYSQFLDPDELESNKKVKDEKVKENKETKEKSESKPLLYSDVISVDGISKNELFNRADLWMANAYVNAEKVIQLKDKENGQIIGKAVMPFNPTRIDGRDMVKGYIRYTIRIYVKDGRYKYEITNFMHDPINSKSGMSLGSITTDEEYQGEGGFLTPRSWKTRIWKDIKMQIDAEMKKLIASLKSGMEITAETKNDNW